MLDIQFFLKKEKIMFSNSVSQNAPRPIPLGKRKRGNEGVSQPFDAKKNKPNEKHISDLPEEILCNVFSLLNRRDGANAQRASLQWRQIGKDLSVLNSQIANTLAIGQWLCQVAANASRAQPNPGGVLSVMAQNVMRSDPFQNYQPIPVPRANEPREQPSPEKSWIQWAMAESHLREGDFEQVWIICALAESYLSHGDFEKVNTIIGLLDSPTAKWKLQLELIHEMIRIPPKGDYQEKIDQLLAWMTESDTVFGVLMEIAERLIESNPKSAKSILRQAVKYCKDGVRQARYIEVYVKLTKNWAKKVELIKNMNDSFRAQAYIHYLKAYAKEKPVEAVEEAKKLLTPYPLGYLADALIEIAKVQMDKDPILAEETLIEAEKYTDSRSAKRVVILEVLAKLNPNLAIKKGAEIAAETQATSILFDLLAKLNRDFAAQIAKGLPKRNAFALLAVANNFLDNSDFAKTLLGAARQEAEQCHNFWTKQLIQRHIELLDSRLIPLGTRNYRANINNLDSHLPLVEEAKNLRQAAEELAKTNPMDQQIAKFKMEAQAFLEGAFAVVCNYIRLDRDKSGLRNLLYNNNTIITEMYLLDRDRALGIINALESTYRNSALYTLVKMNVQINVEEAIRLAMAIQGDEKLQGLAFAAIAGSRYVDTSMSKI